mmetsp:Transcript_7860/g.23389  ORF Transcript_7860/g.23389 Transcript_7860/m.23389 type:complete len:682 (-) Transcript_7860:48-2093(-)
MADAPAARSVFNNIRLQGVGSSGSLTIGREVLWQGKHAQQGTDRRYASADVSRAAWSVFGKYANLAIFGRSGETLMRLDGFERRQRDAVAADCQKAGIALADEEYCSSGANRGKYFFEDDQRLVVEQTGGKEGEEKTRRLFDLDLSKVSQCVLPTTVTNRGGGSKEVSIQFAEERGPGADVHQLVELRLYVPPGSRSEREGDDEDADGGEAERMQKKIQKLANLQSVTGDMLAEFPPEEGGFLLPRGRYAVEMYADFFRMHGNMYDYKIKYADVERFILLPRTDDVHYAFILALERPIRQGQQRYQHLVWQLRKGEHTVAINASEADIEEKYPGAGLKPELSGPLYQLVARVFKALSAKKVFTTGKFRSASGRHAVPCSVKASTGQLYPLERSFVFIHKPTLVLRFEHVASVEFERFSGYGQGSATKNFDIKIVMNGKSSEPGKEHSFTSIERNEYKGLLEFLHAKGLNIKDLKETAAREERDRKAALGMDSGSDEEDAYAQRLKNQAAAESNEEDEESPDEDFVAPGGGDGESSSSSDDDDDGSGDDSDAPPKPETKKAKKERPPKTEKPAPKPAKRKAEPDEKPAKKKAKKKKDPNAPKGKQSSFILFGSSVRGKIKEEHPDFSLGDIGREIGKRWRELDEAGRKPFTDAAAADAERYKTEMAAYKEKLAAEGKDVDEE